MKDFDKEEIKKLTLKYELYGITSDVLKASINGTLDIDEYEKKSW